MMKNKIKKLLQNFMREEETDEISATFTFPESFTGFKGHFPGESILPGVCQIEMVIALSETYYKEELKLLSLSRAKFLNVVKPNDKVKVTGVCSRNGNIISGKFKLTKTENDTTVNISRISLKQTIYHPDKQKA